ncbi:MAG: chromosome partitioning protein ParB, partial [Clostridia bacterium]|nr:chromosome partitioning protein ParB [Clostridia bacterium]
RRKRACERLGLPAMKCEVVDVSRDEAIILMVDSNSQRSEIAPCDKGRAYKMKLEAMKRTPGRPSSDNSTPVGPNLTGTRSNEKLAEEVGESRSQIQRYIRLTNLVPELQDFVDEGKIKMRPAVELSYLDEESQRDVVDLIDDTESFPSHDQAIRMRKAFEAGKLDYNVVDDVMREEKPNQKPSFRIKYEDVKAFFKPTDTPEKVLKDILQGLQLLKRQRDKGAR